MEYWSDIVIFELKPDSLLTQIVLSRIASARWSRINFKEAVIHVYDVFRQSLVIWVGAHVDEYRSSGKPCREFREKVQGRLQETGVCFFFFFQRFCEWQEVNCTCQERWWIAISSNCSKCSSSNKMQCPNIKVCLQCCLVRDEKKKSFCSWWLCGGYELTDVIFNGFESINNALDWLNYMAYQSNLT
jgi:hypothetical protein